MNRLLKYFVISSFKRLSTIVIPVISLVIFILFSWIISMSFSGTITNGYNIILLFIMSSIYMAIKVNTLFKESISSGMELMYITRGTTRIQRLLIKYLTLLIHSLFFSIIIGLGAIIAGYIDLDNATDIWKFFASVLIGNIIVSLFVIPIVIFISTFVNNNGLITLSAIISITIPLFDIIIINTTNVNMYDNLKNKSYSSFSKETLSFSNTIFLSSNDQNENEIYNYHKNSIYNEMVYINPWYQISSLYSLFNDDQNKYRNKRWVQKNDLITNDIKNDFYFNINNQKVIPLSNIKKNIIKENLLRKFINDVLLKSNLKIMEDQISNLNLVEQLWFAHLMFNKKNSQTWTTFLQENIVKINNINTLDKYFISNEHEYIDLYDVMLIKELLSEKIINNPKSIGLANFKETIKNPTKYKTVLLSSDDSIKYYSIHDYVDTKIIIIIWIIIILLLNTYVFIFTTKKEIY